LLSARGGENETSAVQHCSSWAAGARGGTYSFRDHCIEIVFQKTTGVPFQIPVDNISSAAISKAAWTAHQDEEEIAISTVVPVAMFARVPFRTLHIAYCDRLKLAIFNRFWPLR
jgi:hypothetical protein